MYKLIEHQKHTSLIIEILKNKKKIRRSDLYKEVMKLQEKRHGKKTTYQVINRDVDRLLKREIIKIVDGGLRSQILSLR